MPQYISVLETYYAEYLFNICLNASQYFAGRKEVLAWRAWEEGEQTSVRPSCHQLQCKYLREGLKKMAIQNGICHEGPLRRGVRCCVQCGCTVLAKTLTRRRMH